MSHSEASSLFISYSNVQWQYGITNRSPTTNTRKLDLKSDGCSVSEGQAAPTSEPWTILVISIVCILFDGCIIFSRGFLHSEKFHGLLRAYSKVALCAGSEKRMENGRCWCSISSTSRRIYIGRSRDVHRKYYNRVRAFSLYSVVCNNGWSPQDNITPTVLSAHEICCGTNIQQVHPLRNLAHSQGIMPV